MRVFVTGGSGLIGSAVIQELLAAEHEVIGLARSDASAEVLRAAGAEPLAGSLDDPASLHQGAAMTDGVIHLAFGNDFTNIEASIEQEARAVAAYTEALTGTGKPIVIASGTPAAPGRPSTEEDPTPLDGPMAGRGRNAQAILDLAHSGVRSSIVRLPRSVHERGHGFGFASVLIDAARRSGVSGYVGDGTQRWPAVHRVDAAGAFRLALENATPGSTFHAVADEGDSMRSMADIIGAQLGLPVAEVSPDSFGFLGQVFAADQPASGTITRAQLNWQPTHPSLLEDLTTGDYPER